MKLTTIPIDFKTANAFIKKHHRHHLPPRGWKFGIGAMKSGQLVGVVTIGRPVSRHQDNGLTLEVTRCCTDGSHNACSFLYATAWRATRALGYTKLITYTLQSESGISLKAAGWKVLHQTAGGSWNRKARPRDDKHPMQAKLLWEAD